MSDDKNDQHLVVPLNTMQELGREFAGISELIPDINFSGFSAYILLLSYVCRELGHSLPESSFSENSWSYLDSVCNIIIGANQICNPKHEPIANRVRGVVNMLSGSELLLLTTMGFGPVGFVASLGAAFTCSLYATLKTYRRMHDTEYWHIDSQNELDYLKKELKKVKQEIEELKDEQKSGANSGRIVAWLINKKEQHALEVMKKCEKLSIEIENYRLSPTDFSPDLNAEQANNLYNNLMLGTAFTGMLLLCFPGTQPAAMILIACAIGLFCNKHRPTLNTLLSSFQSMVTNYNVDLTPAAVDEDGSGKLDGVGKSI